MFRLQIKKEKMSIIDAYRCDACGIIKIEDEVVGIIPTEDLFDRMNSYPTTHRVNKTTVHYCLDCYRRDVLDIADRYCSRKANEAAYKEKIKEMSYGLRFKAVTNYRLKTFK